MFGTSLKPADAYRRVNVESGIESASPHKLILMLYDGAILAINSAIVSMEAKDIPKKGREISHALEIIGSGLQSSLNLEAGGEIADRLNALYDYMCNRLLYANLKNDPQALREISDLLQELRGAWEEIANDPTVLPKTGDNT
jgi:flagellar protein FliS